jgi:hypothetical protein
MFRHQFLERDLVVRFLTGDAHHDHDIICSFRRQNGRLLAKFFVEPVFGIIKKVLGFQQFSLRGLQKVTLE